jgi:hypothetical protein
VKTELARSQSDAETFFSGASYSPQNSPGSPYQRSPSLKSSESENEVSNVKKNVKSKKDKKTIEKSASSLFKPSLYNTVENKMKTAEKFQCPPHTVYVKNEHPLNQPPVRQENKQIIHVPCLENPQQSKHVPPSSNDLQKIKLGSAFKISNAKFAEAISSNCTKTSTTEINNEGTIPECKTIITANPLPLLITSIQSEAIQDIVMKSEEKKSTEIKSSAKEEKTVVSLKRFSQGFEDKVDKEPPKSPKISTSMLPNNLLELKAKSIALLKKLDNEEVPSINDFSNVKQVKCDSQLQNGMEVNEVQCKETPEKQQCKETPEKQTTVDLMCEDEQEAWRIETKAKMLAKWNADVQEWGNPEPSQVKTPIPVQQIPRFVPSYKTTEADSQVSSCSIFISFSPFNSRSKSKENDAIKIHIVKMHEAIF